ncbi:MAG: hypothetical protein AAF492_21010 [Verrucomicrobiota bacterium]
MAREVKQKEGVTRKRDSARPPVFTLKESLKKYRKEHGQWPVRKQDVLKSRYMSASAIQTFQNLDKLSMSNDVNGRLRIDIKYLSNDNQKQKRLRLFMEPRPQ